MAKKIEKIEALLSDFLNRPVWLVKRNGGYIVQDIATGNFEDRYFFKNLAEVEEFIQADKWTKKNKVMFQVSGKGNITTRVSIPLQWLEDLGISESDRDVKLTKKKNKIILEKAPEEGEKWKVRKW